MINQQLVDYIKQQSQAGVDRDSVRKALADAGWPAADIDDSVKAAEPAAPASAPTASAGPAAGSAVAAVGPVSQPKIDPVAAMGGMSASAADPNAGASSRDKFFAGVKPASMEAAHDDEDDEHPSTKKFVTAMIVMGVVILILAGALAFVYFNLNGQLDAARQASGGGGDAALQAQVAQLTSDKDALSAQVGELSLEQERLVDEIALVVAPAGAASSTPISATVNGILSGNASTSFVLVTTHNVRVTVANSQNAAVTAVLEPLATGASEVSLTGTHLPGSANLTVTAVNGAAL